MTAKEALEVLTGAEIMCLNRPIRKMQEALSTAEAALRDHIDRPQRTAKR